MTYEQWDTIADAYTPALGVLCLLLLLRPLVTRDRTTAAIRAIHLLVGLLIAYGLMLLDDAFGLWAAAGMDYSTHSALSLVLVTYLCIHAPRLMLLWDLSLLLYFLLLIYQQYHSASDLVTTTLAVMVTLYASFSVLNRANKSEEPEAAS